MIQDPVWKECFKITEDYALKNLCFNFDSQIFNFMLDEFRNRKNIKLAKKLVSLNKCQKYNKIGRKDVVKLE